MYMCFLRNLLLNHYGRLISSHWLQPVMDRYLLYKVLIRTVPMLLSESRDKAREVPSVEPSVEHLFNRRSVAWSLKPWISLVPNTLLRWTNVEEAWIFNLCVWVSVFVTLGVPFLWIGWTAVSRYGNSVSLFSDYLSYAKEVFFFPKTFGKDFLRITLSVYDNSLEVLFVINSGCVSRFSTSSL